MFVEFNSYHGSRMAVRPEQVIYISVSDETTTWIVFGPNDFEVRVKHPYKYVMEQLSKSKQEEQPCASNLVWCRRALAWMARCHWTVKRPYSFTGDFK